MTVRQAAEADLAPAGALLTRVYLDEGWSAESSRARLGDARTLAKEGTLLVAGEERQVLGAVILVPPGSPLRQVGAADEAEVRLLAVAPEARGLGLGEALMAELGARAQAAGFAAVVLSTQQGMTSAQRLYERLGYLRQPARDWDGALSRMLVYRRQLPPA